MSRLLEKKKVVTGKIFVEGDLKVTTKNAPQGYVEWWYHVAPIVMIEGNDHKRHMVVIDPSIFDHPVTPDEWIAIQTLHHKDQPDLKRLMTKRFVFVPSETNDDMGGYSADDLQRSEQTLKDYLEIAIQRRKERSAAQEKLKANQKAIEEAVAGDRI